MLFVVLTIGSLSAGLPCLQYRSVCFREQLVGDLIAVFSLQIEENLCKLGAIIPYFSTCHVGERVCAYPSPLVLNVTCNFWNQLSDCLFQWNDWHYSGQFFFSPTVLTLSEGISWLVIMDFHFYILFNFRGMLVYEGILGYLGYTHHIY